MPALSENALGHPFWGRGFRPFFLLGAIYTMLGILMWTGVYSGHSIPPDIFSDPVTWHAHEMIYGFGMAIVAGFLLTAVANWTSGAPVRQIQLMVLCGLWTLGRIMLNIPGLPGWAMIAGELTFIPVLAASLALPLIKSWNTRNFIFLGLLTAMWVCDAVFMATQSRIPLYIALVIILAMISLIGGRVIPAFTVGALRRKGIEVRIYDQHKMDGFALLSLLTVVLALLFAGVTSMVFAVSCFASSLIHLARMRHYHTKLTFDDPLVWILHAGYAWLVIGLFLAGLSVFSVGMFPAALHAITVGAIGSMTLGMMARVTLGHTGRPLFSNRLTTFSFGSMQLAAILRAFGPVVMPEHYTFWVVSSGLLWAACFLLYVIVYAPMLWTSRPDKQPA
ncbi:MAG: NnrS family protein [Micavibrio sp.]